MPSTASGKTMRDPRSKNIPAACLVAIVMFSTALAQIRPEINSPQLPSHQRNTANERASKPAADQLNDPVDIIGPEGSQAFGDEIITLPNGNFLVADPEYDAPGPVENVGRIHLYDGLTLELISTMTGTSANDRVGHYTNYILSTGDIAVVTPYWSNAGVVSAGAVTLCSAVTGCPETITPENSLVGTNEFDQVGIGGVVPFPDGRFVVTSYYWNNERGAVTLCPVEGCVGEVSTSNSLHGTQQADQVGFYTTVPLTNGNYVVMSQFWGGTEIFSAQLGAATFCSGTTGCTGPVTPENSLVGSEWFDSVGSQGIHALPNGNYVVGSANWQQAGSFNKLGAVTFCNGTTGCTGTISAANSLIGTGTNPAISSSGIILLTDGSYVVGSSRWNGNRGAVTWCNGDTGCTGTVTAANSLTGLTPNDFVGGGSGAAIGGIRALHNGGYVVFSPVWDGTLPDVGAVTFCGTPAACTGAVVSTANSMTGTQASDHVGELSLTVLTNGNFVVYSRYWNNGPIVDAGASTLCSGATGCPANVTPENSLVGTTANDNVGMGAVALTNGNYVVRSPNWDNGAIVNAGAATLCNGVTGCTGPVTPENSLVGTSPEDRVGSTGITVLPHAKFIVRSPLWDNGPISNAGAFTIGDGYLGLTGEISSANSILGNTVDGGSRLNFGFDTANNRLIFGIPDENRIIVFPALAPTAANVLVSGRVTSPRGGIANVRVTLTAQNGSQQTVNTNGFGYFQFSGVESGQTYVAAATAKAHSFAPQVLHLTDNFSELHFSALH